MLGAQIVKGFTYEGKRPKSTLKDGASTRNEVSKDPET